MKEMTKAIIITDNLINNVINEKNILSKLRCKLITNMKCAFQDFSKLYLVLELMKGGSLRYHLNHFQGYFPEQMIRFIIINISLCLAYIHQNNIVHRDIKPENFLFDDRGYLHLSDFNSAVFINEENKKNDLLNNYDYKSRINMIEKKLVGTLSYIAPEYILAIENNTTFISEFYSFGVIIYELMARKKPFIGKTRVLLGEEMIQNEINFDFNYRYSNILKKFVKKLLAINPKERLGLKGGFQEIKTQGLFYDFNWKKFNERKYISPFEEVIKSFKKIVNPDKKEDIVLYDFTNNNFNTINLNEEGKMAIALIESNPSFLRYFKDYNYLYFEKDDFQYRYDIDNNQEDDDYNVHSKFNSFRVKNNKRRHEYIIRYSSSGSSSNKRYSSCSNGSSSNYSIEYSDDRSSYFCQKDKSKNKKKIVYLPVIEKEKKVVIPEIYQKIVLDAYKYKMLKYKSRLNKINDKEKKGKSPIEKKRLNKSEIKDDRRYILDNIKFPMYPNPNTNPLYLNNFLYTKKNYNLQNPCSSMNKFNRQMLSNLSKVNPFFKMYKDYYYPIDDKTYSLISSSETYDQLVRKNKSNTHKKEEINKKEDKKQKKDNQKEKEKTNNKEHKNKELKNIKVESNESSSSSSVS